MGGVMSDPEIGETYFISPASLVGEWFGEVQQEVKFCEKCKKWDTIKFRPSIGLDKLLKCDCPKPFVTTCHFCGVDVEMQKDATEGKPVACFDCSHKFTPKVKV